MKNGEYTRHEESRDIYDLVNEKGVKTASIAQAMDRVKERTRQVKKNKIIAKLKGGNHEDASR